LFESDGDESTDRRRWHIAMSTQQTEEMPLWHSLMYSTGILTSLAVPVIPLGALLAWLSGELTLIGARYFAGVMFVLMAPLGASLWLGAILITKYQASRASQK
jgi:hypothetical protein